MVLVNGIPQKFVSASDRGLNYGDGLFESMVVIDDQIRFFNTHLERLKVGCEKLAIPIPTRTEIESDLSKLSAAESGSTFVFKVLITRGESGRGYLADIDSSTTRVSSRHPLSADFSKYWDHGLNMHICETRLAINPTLAGIKHANRLEQVLASMERIDTEFDEGLMLSMGDEVVEGTKSNIFWQKGGQYFTPDLKQSGVVGVGRTKVIEMLEQNNKVVNIGSYSVADVHAADLVFMTNSTMLIAQVRRLEGTKWLENPLIKELRQTLVSNT